MQATHILYHSYNTSLYLTQYIDMLDEFFNCVCVGISIQTVVFMCTKKEKLGNEIIWAVDPLLSPKRPLVAYSVYKKVWKHEYYCFCLIQQLDT